jgi:hydrogenase nickel incorporation protein HypA/HybF
MHELSIATAVIDTCVAHAGGARVLRVRMEVGRLVAVLPDSLRFCFDACAEGTPVEGAVLEILETPGRAVCDDCLSIVDLTAPFGVCACGGSLRIVAGQELCVKDMEIA